MNPVSARLPVQRDQPLEPDGALDLVALGLRALVVPEDRRPEHLVARVQRHQPVHLAAQPDAGGVAGRVGQLRQHGLVARHQSSGSCSDQPGRGVDSGYSASARARTAPSGSIASPLTAVVPTSMPNRTVSSGGVEIAGHRLLLYVTPPPPNGYSGITVE